MYEAILKTALEDSDFEFITSDLPLPKSRLSQFRHQYTIGYVTIFVIAMISSLLISEVV